jgi:hypothetical protein
MFFITLCFSKINAGGLPLATAAIGRTFSSPMNPKENRIKNSPLQLVRGHQDIQLSGLSKKLDACS